MSDNLESENSAYRARLATAENEIARLRAEVERLRAVPEGWKLVPVVLTDEMEEVAARISDGPLVSFHEHWHAMLAAAPEPIQRRET